MSASLDTFGQVNVHDSVDWEVVIRDFINSGSNSGICKVVEILITDKRDKVINVVFYDSVITSLIDAIVKDATDETLLYMVNALETAMHKDRDEGYSI